MDQMDLRCLSLADLSCSHQSSKQQPTASSGAGNAQTQALPVGLPGKDSLQTGPADDFGASRLAGSLPGDRPVSTRDSFSEPDEGSGLMDSLSNLKAATKAGRSSTGFQQPAASDATSGLAGRSERSSMASDPIARSSQVNSAAATSGFGTSLGKQAAGSAQPATKADQAGLSGQSSFGVQRGKDAASTATSSRKTDLARSQDPASLMSTSSLADSYPALQTSTVTNRASTGAQARYANMPQSGSNSSQLASSKDALGKNTGQEQTAGYLPASSSTALPGSTSSRYSAGQSGSAAQADDDALLETADTSRQMPAAAGRSSQRASRQTLLAGQQTTDSLQGIWKQPGHWPGYR